MAEDEVSRLGIEVQRLLRRAYEAGVRDGRAAVEAELSLAIVVGGEAAKREQADAYVGSIGVDDAGRQDKGVRESWKKWGTVRPVVYEAIEKAPGRTWREVEAATGEKRVSIRTALEDFVSTGLATKDGSGRYLAVDFARNREAMRPKRMALKAEILSFVRGHPRTSTSDVVAAIGLRQGSIRTKLYALRKEGKLVGDAGGWLVAGSPVDQGTETP